MRKCSTISPDGEENDSSNKNSERCFFTREKNDTSSQKPQRCASFEAKTSAFYRRLQLPAPLCKHSTKKFFSKCFSRKKSETHLGNWNGIVSFVSLLMKKTVESRQTTAEGEEQKET